MPTATKKKRSRNHNPSQAIPLKRVENAVDIMTNPAEANDDNILYRHSAMCQTYLPYRNPGDDVTEYTHKNGNTTLIIQATKVHTPDDKLIYVGLPYGPKARLAMMHIDTMAILQKSREVEVKESMTSFVAENLGLSNSGYNIRQVKEQMTRLAACMISVAKVIDHKDHRQVKQFDSKLIQGFDLWFPKDNSQRVLWSSVIHLSGDYFESLMNQAVPHDMRMVAALSNNAMALDVLSWLTQRLHRIPHGNPAFVTWKQLKDQFGTNYGMMKNFKRDFRKVLTAVLQQYREAKIEEVDNQGFRLFNSKTPVPYRPTPLIKG